VDEMMFNIYKGKRVLVTGCTGFKGSWLSLWLTELGATVCGYALTPNTQPSLFNVLNLNSQISYIAGDILDRAKLEKTFNDFRPEVVFHLAAQPLVRLSYAEPVLTYETNVIGTLNVLEAARKCGSVKVFVNVTTDKCYENKEVAKGYVETDPMGGYDMYSSSKGCAELLSSSYRRSFLADDFALSTARAGNVIGGGDWAQDRLLPDCAKAISNGEKIEIRNPIAVRPWQHVLEPLSGYLTLGERLLTDGHKYAEGFNFGPHEESVLTVAEVARLFIQYYGAGELLVHKRDTLHEAGLLMLNIEKAQQVLNWTPVLKADKAIKDTAEWYKLFYAGKPMLDYTLQQIKNYQDKL
jgi:CDP-glucose 4,6-dehydratase